MGRLDRISLVRECISAIVSVAGEDNREPTPAMASSSKGKWGREYVHCPASSIRYMRPYAMSSSTSWSRRSSMLWMSASLPFLRAHSRHPMRPSAKLATLLAAKCLPGVLAEADNKGGEHDSRSSTSMARPNTNGAPHLRARA